jgi:hypothetical protein
MEPYKVYLHLDLLDTFPKRGRQRALIMRFIRSLAANPFALGDFTDQDATLRTRQIKIVGEYAVTYWVDDPVKTVMVVDVRPADK